MGRSRKQFQQGAFKKPPPCTARPKVSRNRPNKYQLNTMIEFMEDNHDFAHEEIDDEMVYRHLLLTLTRKLNKLGKIPREPDAVQRSWRDQKQNTLEREAELLAGERTKPLSAYDMRVLRVIRRQPPLRDESKSEISHSTSKGEGSAHVKEEKVTLFHSTPKGEGSAHVTEEKLTRSEMPRKNEYFYDDDDVSSWENESGESQSDDQYCSEYSTDKGSEYLATESKKKGSRKLSNVNWTPRKESTKKTKLNTPSKIKKEAVKNEDDNFDVVIVSDEEEVFGIDNQQEELSPLEMSKRNMEILEDMISRLRLAFKKQEHFLMKYLKQV